MAGAPAVRANRDPGGPGALALANHPVVQALLDAAGVSAVVLNRERQIIVGNEALLTRLRAESAEAVQGRRLGEALGCVHAGQSPGDCETGPECAACGLRLAILASQATDAVVERECRMSVQRGGQVDVCELRVKASQIEIGGERFTIVGLRDTRVEKRRAALERVFLHDISNTLGILLPRAEILAARAPVEMAETAQCVQFLAERLRDEIEDQCVLLQAENGTLKIKREPVPPGEALDLAAAVLRGHPLAQARTLRIGLTERAAIATDASLLVRVLVNMMKNALEATPEGGEVRAWTEVVPEGCEFRVWNAAAIPADIALQIFRRSFSTKPGHGRGLGTLSMKLIGEHYLGGSVSFSSTAADGTTFTLRLPV